jgi:hypothetical protein
MGSLEGRSGCATVCPETFRWNIPRSITLYRPSFGGTPRIALLFRTLCGRAGLCRTLSQHPPGGMPSCRPDRMRLGYKKHLDQTACLYQSRNINSLRTGGI